MIGTQETGRVEGVVVSAVAHEGLSVTIDGQPGKLAVITNDGQIVAAGKDVAKECMAVAVNCYRNMWMAQGHLRVFSGPLTLVDEVAGQDGDGVTPDRSCVP